jgi:hypothetical protein
MEKASSMAPSKSWGGDSPLTVIRSVAVPPPAPGRLQQLLKVEQAAAATAATAAAAAVAAASMDGDATEMFFGKGDRLAKMRERVSHDTMAGSARSVSISVSIHAGSQLKPCVAASSTAK